MSVQAALTIQKYARGLRVFREFSKNPVHSSLLKKLSRVFQNSPHFNNNVKQEAAAVQLLSACFERRKIDVSPAQTSSKQLLPLRVSPTRCADARTSQ